MTDEEIAGIKDRVTTYDVAELATLHYHATDRERVLMLLGKTYTARKTLDQLGVRYTYHVGHFTPMGLFELLDEEPDGITVLDDVATLFSQPTAIQSLLAAFGQQPNGPRLIKYRRRGHDATSHFLVLGRSRSTGESADAETNGVSVVCHGHLTLTGLHGSPCEDAVPKLVSAKRRSGLTKCSATRTSGTSRKLSAARAGRSV